jgi:hypothetical protein
MSPKPNDQTPPLEEDEVLTAVLAERLGEQPEPWDEANEDD